MEIAIVCPVAIPMILGFLRAVFLGDLHALGKIEGQVYGAQVDAARLFLSSIHSISSTSEPIDVFIHKSFILIHKSTNFVV